MNRFESDAIWKARRKAKAKAETYGKHLAAAYYEGREDYLYYGARWCDNPYKAGTPASDRWNDGWDAGAAAVAI